MRINEFSSKYNLSYDTIRYYMKLNLIIAEKKGGRYEFTAECEQELEEILKLKKMGFSLQDIKNIFNFKRIGKLTPYQCDNYYRDLYRDRIQEVKEKIAELNIAREELEAEIAALALKNRHSNGKESIRIGVDLSLLPIFRCPNCKQELLLTAERIEKNQIITGTLNCSCGESFQIKEGILYCEKRDDDPDIIDNNHIVDYIRNTDSDFIDQSYQVLEWMQRQLEFESLSGKVIMEPGTGYGHFLRQIYNRLSEDTIYICVDHNHQLNKYLKKMLELSEKRVKVVFITAALPDLPLKDNIVDFLFDFSGTSNYAFNNEGFLPELLDHYLKSEASILASFIIYQNFGPDNVVAALYRNNFKYENIRKRLLKMGFKLEEEFSSEKQKIQKNIGKYETFAQPGDRIYSYQVKAARWS